MSLKKREDTGLDYVNNVGTFKVFKSKGISFSNIIDVHPIIPEKDIPQKKEKKRKCHHYLMLFQTIALLNRH